MMMNVMSLLFTEPQLSRMNFKLVGVDYQKKMYFMVQMMRMK